MVFPGREAEAECLGTGSQWKSVQADKLSPRRKLQKV